MQGVFRHGVASGDPLIDRIVIWTRVTSQAEAVDVDWVMATDPRLAEVVARGEVVAGAEDDHTVQIDVGGLDPGREYFYGFGAAAETLADRAHPNAPRRARTGPLRRVLVREVQCRFLQRIRADRRT